MWTDERIETLTRLWNDGWSASWIASEMGLVSRNSVIGKVHRLGLARRPKMNATSPRKRAYRKAPRTGISLPKTSVADPDVEADIIPDPPADFQPGIKTLVELTDRTCRWPMGHPKDADFHFCGQFAPGRSPYCPLHHKRAYTKLETA